MFRELNLALLELRILQPEIGLVMTRVVGDVSVALGIDEVLESGAENWFIHEVSHFLKRMLKRYENTAKSFYAVMDEGTAFAGTSSPMKAKDMHAWSVQGDFQVHYTRQTFT